MNEANELRERVAELEQRVAELESGGSTTNTQGLDHRDEAVLDRIRTLDTEPSARQTLKMYTRLTDITSSKTAKNRAKALRGRDVYTEAINE